MAMILFEKFGQHQPRNRQAERHLRPTCAAARRRSKDKRSVPVRSSARAADAWGRASVAGDCGEGVHHRGLLATAISAAISSSVAELSNSSNCSSI
jgi:hypothetical protein